MLPAKENATVASQRLSCKSCFDDKPYSKCQSRMRFRYSWISAAVMSLSIHLLHQKTSNEWMRRPSTTEGFTKTVKSKTKQYRCIQGQRLSIAKGWTRFLKSVEQLHQLQQRMGSADHTNIGTKTPIQSVRVTQCQ